MKRLALTAALAGSIAVTGCATNPYNDHQVAGAATGAAIGAVGGAVAGAILPGVSAGTGAIAGAVLGGVVGAVKNGHQYYRDTRGYCYYVDQYGQPHYNYNIRC